MLFRRRLVKEVVFSIRNESKTAAGIKYCAITLQSKSKAL